MSEMDDDKSYTDYMSALADHQHSMPLHRISLTRGLGVGDFFKCKCGAVELRALGETETYCTIADYKVVEGVRLKVIGCDCGPGGWLKKKLADVSGEEHTRFTDQFGGFIPPPQIVSFLDILKNGVRMKDRPMAIPAAERAADIMLDNMVPLHHRGRGATSFPEHQCGIPIEDLLPVDWETVGGTITDAKTGVTKSLDEALKEVRHKGESFPSPYLTHVYTVNPDE